MDPQQYTNPPSEAAPVQNSTAPLVNQPVTKSRRGQIILGAVFALVILLFIGVGIYILGRNQSAPKSPIVPTPAPIELNLKKEVLQMIPGSRVGLIYKGTDIKEPECFDCSTSTQIDMSVNNTITKLSYLCGGIAGQCDIVKEGNGYSIELLSQDQQGARVRVSKK